MEKFVSFCQFISIKKKTLGASFRLKQPQNYFEKQKYRETEMTIW